MYDLFLPNEYGTRRHMGYAFVAMDEDKVADAVKHGAEGGFELKGMRLRIEFAKEKSEKQRNPGPGAGLGPNGPGAPPVRKIHVSGLLEEVVAGDVRALFERRYGGKAIYDLFLPCAPGTRKHMGYAFVAMEEDKVADAVKHSAQGGFELNGKEIR